MCTQGRALQGIEKDVRDELGIFDDEPKTVKATLHGQASRKEEFLGQ